MKPLSFCLIAVALWPAPSLHGQSSRAVRDSEQLQAALAAARPGETILVAPGQYRGGITVRQLHGEPGKPIIVKASEPSRPPTFKGRSFAIQMSQVSHIELHDLVVTGATGNGVNIDDGGVVEKPSHHLLLKNLVVRDIGPEGNHDGIKLSGVDDFRVEDCTLERWGAGGSGIDMVGCHRGEIIGCVFRHGDTVGSSGVQIKGGSHHVAVRKCRFDHAGRRAVHLGGSTGLSYFRPRTANYEAEALLVEDCTFNGSEAPIAFVGVNGAEVRHNTFYRPRRWVFRILQENREPGFITCRDGHITENVIVFRADEMVRPINVGSSTEPQSFKIARNAWYCQDAPSRGGPRLDIPEIEGVHGVDPGFMNAEAGDLTIRPDGPLRASGGQQGPRSDQKIKP